MSVQLSITPCIPTLFLSSMPLSHKMTEALTDSSASKTFHEQSIISSLGRSTGIKMWQFYRHRTQKRSILKNQSRIWTQIWIQKFHISSHTAPTSSYHRSSSKRCHFRNWNCQFPSSICLGSGESEHYVISIVRMYMLCILSSQIDICIVKLTEHRSSFDLVDTCQLFDPIRVWFIFRLFLVVNPRRDFFWKYVRRSSTFPTVVD
jgi:hypothetical protein